MKNPTPAEAKRYLAVVTPEWKAFWFHKGPVVKSLKELLSALPKVPAQMFEHHVNSTKNDLAAWVKDVVGDADLAVELKTAKTVKAAMESIDQRLKQLDKSMVVVAPRMKTKK